MPDKPNSVTIQHLRAWLEQLPLRKPYRIAYKNITDTAIVCIELVWSNGMVSRGAANPFEEVVGESPEQTLLNWQQPVWQQLIGQPIENYAAMIAQAWQWFPMQPGTIAALDIALHDALAQKAGKPLAQLLGQIHRALPTSVTIGIMGVDDTLREAAEYYAQGFRVLKVKTGLHPAEDAERLCQLHARYGASVQLRADANQGYTLQQLQTFLQLTAQVPLELVEQPLPAHDDADLVQLPVADRQRLCADESLVDEAAARRLCQPPLPYGIFNIKLMKCGGIRSALQIAALARPAGIGLFWGCNDESVISIAAALHVAYSCAHTRYLDLDGCFDLSRDVATGGFTLRQGMMYLTDKPGLGF